MGRVGHSSLARERSTMARLTRTQVREAVERAGDEHWQALIRHHEDAYPASRPTPGDVCRAEAERLNQLGLGDAEELTLVETRVERTDSTVRIVQVTGDRDEVRHQVEREREVSDERSQDELVPPGHAWVAEQPPHEHDAVGDEACHAARALSAA